MGFKDQTGLQAKAIRSILTEYCDAWVKTLPAELRAQVRRDTIVTGGCIASMLLGEEVNDVDLYFRTYETAVAVAKHYVEQWKDASIQAEELLDVRGEKRVRVKVQSDGMQARQAKFGSFAPTFMSSNAITLAGHPYPLQIVLRFWGEPDKIHSTYDFAHCTNYWEMATNKLTLRPEALESLLSRTLIYRGSLYPVCSIMRLRKFIRRGWRINAGQILKILLQISGLKLDSFKVMEDQLTGVDSAYFEQALRLCREGDDDQLDMCRFVQVLDKVFEDGPEERSEGAQG